MSLLGNVNLIVIGKTKYILEGVVRLIGKLVYLVLDLVYHEAKLANVEVSAFLNDCLNVYILPYLCMLQTTVICQRYQFLLCILVCYVYSS